MAWGRTWSEEACRAIYRHDFAAFFEDVQAATSRIVRDRFRPQPPEIVRLPTPSETPTTWPAGLEGWTMSSMLRNLHEPNWLADHFPRGMPPTGSVRWAEKPLKGLWGFCRYDDMAVVLSPHLNSPDVPLFVAEFVLFHELLHAELTEEGHSRRFRERESRYRPTTPAREDAVVRGITEPSGALRFWQVVADNFLDTWHKRYRM